MDRLDASAKPGSENPTRLGGGLTRIALVSLLALEAACVGTIGGDEETLDEAPPSETAEETEVSSSALRRLSVHELTNTLEAVVGVVPAAIERVPPDGLGHSFDRVVNDQTMSPAHFEAYAAIASEVSLSLLSGGRLGELVSGCPAESIPSLLRPETRTIDGNGFSLEPAWAVNTTGNPEHGGTTYAPNPAASYNHAFDTAGLYELRFDFTTSSPVDLVEVLVDGQVVSSESTLAGAQSMSAQIELADAGSHVITLSLDTNPDDSSLAVVFEALIVEGPLSDVPQPSEAQVEECALSIIDELAPTAYRRPLVDEERQRLASIYETMSAEHGAADGLSTLLEAIFSSPHFTYLVEVGEPVPGREGFFRLGPWELASRLSYAICEQPPDAELWDAAASGALSSPAEIEAQARRLFEAPCARATVERFFEHWLWLNELPSLTKSQEIFPNFDEALREGLVAESERYLAEMVWKQEASIATLFGADYGWPNDATASFYGMPEAEGQKSMLPPERAGILTSPAVLAVTGSFDGTSPVRRGVYVLEQILCADLPPPPNTEDIAPPLPDPGLTTRERWAAHTEEPACASCHQAIDPIGFSLEEFDGIGQHRTEENGHPVDASGGVPTLGVEDGEIVGGAALATVIAESPRLKSCVATQWLRFTFGRLETAGDVGTIDAVTTAFDEQSIREALISIVTTEGFLHRTEGK